MFMQITNFGGEGEKTMISNQILQNTIDGLKAITRTDLCVIDVEGKILAAQAVLSLPGFLPR